MIKKATTALLIASLALMPNYAMSIGSSKVLPEGTRLYLKLDQHVSGKRGDAEPGDIVPCSVWRDVDLQGVVLVKSGTRATCKVESVKHANIAGIKGKIVLAALDTKTVDGQMLQLTGGYNKEGKSRMALSISLGVLVFLPLIFITGSAAELPVGTVIDVYSGPDMPVAVNSGSSSIPAISLGGMASPFSADVVLDDFMVPNAKPEVFKIKISNGDAVPSGYVIDNVNGKPIEAIALQMGGSQATSKDTRIGTVSIKTLSKHFQKGINRFEVAYSENGQRRATEVILNIQM
jgi:hypothetical protein